MSEERLLKLELKLDESTTAMMELTKEISLLVQSNNHAKDLFEENKQVTKTNTNRITNLELESASQKSNKQKWDWIERTVYVGIVGAILKATGII